MKIHCLLQIGRFERGKQATAFDIFWYIQAYIGAGAVKHWGLTTLSPAFCKFAAIAKINVNNLYKNFSISGYKDAANLLRGNVCIIQVNVYDLRALKHIKFPPKINLQKEKKKTNQHFHSEGIFRQQTGVRASGLLVSGSGPCRPNPSQCSVVAFLACRPDWKFISCRVSVKQAMHLLLSYFSSLRALMLTLFSHVLFNWRSPSTLNGPASFF